MANESGSTPTNRSPAFWGLVAVCAVVLALVVSIASYNVVSNEPAGASKDTTIQSQQVSPMPNEAERSTGAVSKEPGKPTGPAESPGTTTTGSTGRGDSAR
jgi:hypothetical protein